jgi:hypothetical protein
MTAKAAATAASLVLSSTIFSSSTTIEALCAEAVRLPPSGELGPTRVRPAFIKGKIFGGDTGYAYTASYQTEKDSLKARVMVRNYLDDLPSVLDVVGDFELNIIGKIEGDVITSTGSVPNLQAVGLALKLTKREST